MTPYETGLKTAAEKLSIDRDALIALLHGLPIPGTSIGSMIYEGATDETGNPVASPLFTGLGALGGATVGSVLGGAAGLLPLLASQGNPSPAAIASATAIPMLTASLGSGLGAYGARKIFG